MGTMENEKSKLVRHTARADGHEITLRLSEAQRAELMRLTGKDLTHLKIGIQQLADIGDLIAN